MDDNYIPSGELQGDTAAMPNRGTSTGMVGNTDLQGMSTDVNATNSRGSAYTSPTPMDESEPEGDGTIPNRGDNDAE